MLCHRAFLGWMHHSKGVPLEQLSFHACIPSAERNGVAIAFEYIQWLVDERDINVRTEGLVVRSIMQAAKFLYHQQSTVQVRRQLTVMHSNSLLVQQLGLR